MGRSRELRPVQKTFKTSWEKLQVVPIKGTYSTNIDLWQCNCGAQKYSPHLLCKHLVQAVSAPSPDFFVRVVRRRTVPFYRHPELCERGKAPGAFVDPDDGCITDGDDHVWLGDRATLRGTGAWRDIKDGRDAALLGLKRRRSPSVGSVLSEAVSYEASEIDGADEDALADEVRRITLLHQLQWSLIYVHSVMKSETRSTSASPTCATLRQPSKHMPRPTPRTLTSGSSPWPITAALPACRALQTICAIRTARVARARQLGAVLRNVQSRTLRTQWDFNPASLLMTPCQRLSPSFK